MNWPPHSTDPWYQPLRMSSEEKVNGYALYAMEYLRPFTRRYFGELVTMWKEDAWTEQELRDKFNVYACSDWSKMDDHGECFGGFWREPEGSYERKNASRLSHAHNLDALCSLPFPHRVKWETVDIGCRNRFESVRYTNFLCTWLQRKMEQMEKETEN